MVGPPLVDSMLAYGLDDADARRGVTVYRERYDRIGWRENSVFDGMASLLDDLVAGGRTLAIATSKPHPVATRILEHFDLDRYFTTITGADESVGRRSKADVIAKALDVLGSEVKSTPPVMIGDRSHDVEGAAAHGLPAIAVGWGYARPGEVDEAAWTVATVPELREVLRCPTTTPT
ncbi:HAD hydrolase-like protein [Gordonia sp. (in: high G+C Gram-positive bacteria)]|uniref:HAD hydrolase-like protein n=1 Tax=Gordonia sp. (in: high G+C Gram-positive bacteria) TaxID=84139 RepID=UPI0039E29026